MTATTLSPEQCKAIEALVNSPSVADAARVRGMSAKKLSRWMENPEFDAQYEAATRASFHHQMTRQRQGATLAVKSTIRIMHEGKKPADRLKASRLLIRLAEDDKEIREFEVTVRKLEQIPLASFRIILSHSPANGVGYSHSQSRRKTAQSSEG